MALKNRVWQKKHAAASQRALKGDLGGAARQVSRQGRPLTAKQQAALKLPAQAKTPIKTLVFRNGKLAAV